MTAINLIDDALAERRTWKLVGDQLCALPPDRNAADHIVALYSAGDCEPWMTVFFPGCIGHPGGYETVKEILLSGSGNSSASYASVAMAKMCGDACYGDQHKILISDASKCVRNGAVYGMEDLNHPNCLNDFFNAFLSGHLRK